MTDIFEILLLAKGGKTDADTLMNAKDRKDLKDKLKRFKKLILENCPTDVKTPVSKYLGLKPKFQFSYDNSYF